MLSSIDQITSIVNTSSDFSFSKTLGSFINNREFYKSFEDFSNMISGGPQTPKSFTWEVLSSIGDDIGGEIYRNIRDYIDLVSDVDKCKTQNLRSMFLMYGESYNVFDNLDKYPVEVLKLVDIFSINPKYILKNGFMKRDFIEDLSASGAINISHGEYYSDSHSNVISSVDTVNEQLYDNYVKNIFKTLISDFLDLKYNNVYETPVRETLTQEDILGYSLSSFEKKYDEQVAAIKEKYGITNSFDEQEIVDNIDNGTDFIENYDGCQLEVINAEIARRARTLNSELSSIKSALDQAYNSAEQKTRYSYYRKAKVLEYNNFINNFLTKPQSNKFVQRYSYDQSYFELGSDNTISSVLIPSGTDKKGYVINENVVEYASNILLKIVKYIQILRDRIKLQTRKNYMKGTANLLRYIINQYLVDYARNSHVFEDKSLSDVFNVLSSHSVNQVDVVEYWDETEYFNISSQTSNRALNGGNVNERYWQGQTGQRAQTGFTDNEIYDFYLRKLRLSSDSFISNLVEFLDAIYNLGANTSFIDKNNGRFTTKLSANPDMYSDTYHEMLSDLTYHYAKYEKYILSDYEYSYPEDVLSNQISDVIDNYISGYLSAQYLSAISSVYLKYIDKLYNISNDVASLCSDYNNFLTDQYTFYYIKSKSKYCYKDRVVTDDDKDYNYDYYIGNTEYDTNNIYDKLLNLKRYSIENEEKNIVFHGLHDTISALSDELTTLSSEYISDESDKSTIYSELSGYGYIDLSAITLGESLDNAESFANEQIDARMQYLKNLISELLLTTRNLKSEILTAETTFANALASYDDENATEKLTDDTLYMYSLSKGDENTGFHRTTKVSDIPKAAEVAVVKREGTIYYYYQKGDDKGQYIQVECSNILPYNDDDPIEDKIKSIISRLVAPTCFTYQDGVIGEMFYDRMNEGIYTTCTSIQKTLVDISASYDVLCSTLEEIGISYTPSGGSLKEKLDNLISKLTATDPSSEFANDTVLNNLNSIKKRIVTVRAQYNPLENEYQDIASENEFVYYLMGFSFKSQEFSFNQLQKVLDYIDKTDIQNRQKISKIIDDFFIAYDTINTTFNNLEISASEELNEYGSSGHFIEDRLNYLRDALLIDIQLKRDENINIIFSILEDVSYHLRHISAYLSSYYDTTTSLSDAYYETIRQISYQEFPEYLSSYAHFKMYNGICSDSDIYYNYKNITHPSKQYHPYLWNFIKSDQFINNYTNTYNLQSIENLNEEYIISYIDQYIGEFGQTINFWKNTGIDYTGYSSRYENSSHIYDVNRSAFSRIMDYDGLFFPEAVDYYKKYGSETCISSLDESQTGAYLKSINSKRNEIRQAIKAGNSDLSARLTEELNQMLPVYDVLSSFWDKFYKPLGLTRDEVNEEKDRLSSFSPYISDIVTEHKENEIYDIYRYGVDTFNNAYNLVKRYKDDNGNFYPLYKLSEKIKKNTKGKLWIRRSAYPFAYPAFAFKYGNFDIAIDYTALSNSLSSELISTDQCPNGNMDGNIYDFEFSFNKNALVLINGNNKGSDGFEQFDTANIFVAKIHQNINDTTKFVVDDYNFNDDNERVEKYIGTEPYAADFVRISSLTLEDIQYKTILNVANSEMSVVFSNKQIAEVLPRYEGTQGTVVENISETGALSDYIEYRIKDIYGRNSISDIISSDQDTRHLTGYSDWTGNTFVGVYPYGNEKYYFVFAEKNIKADQDGSISVKLNQNTSLTLLEYNSGKKKRKATFTLPGAPSIEDVAATLVDTKTLAVAYVIDSVAAHDNSLMNAFTTDGHVVSGTNSNGFVYDDPYNKEMNSHDVFASNIFVKKFSIDSNFGKAHGESTNYNINADMSYLPVYPGVSSKVDVPTLRISSDEYFPIELLGQSRDIHELAERVNPTPNPYFSLEEISANYTFGRVYEDYIQDYDKTVKILDNPPIYNNIPSELTDSVSYDNKNGQFIWTVDMKNQFLCVDYSEKDYKSMKIFMFNRRNFGKNPYIICELSDALENEITANYNDDNGGFEVPVSFNLNATGTYDNKSVNSLENNRLDNIFSITLRFISKGSDEDTDEDTDKQRKIKVYFKLQDPNKKDNTFINSGQICLCLLNHRDLSMFKYYHYMDAYGLYISAETRDFSEYDPNPKYGDGWKITYDQDFLNVLSSGYAWNYCFDRFGRKTYLREIDFEKYNALSDIDVLQGYKKAIFKYDEELYFSISDDNYYFPSLNLKYPKTAGMYVNDIGATLKIEDNSEVISVFQDNELFMIDIPNSNAIFKNIGKIRMDVGTFNGGFYLVSEDYMQKDTPKYSPEDPRVFEYVLFTKDREVDVENRALLDVNMELAVNDVFPICLEDANTTQFITMDVSQFASDDLKKLMRIYINYQKDIENGNDIVLYFNYLNYINTPFIKIVDGKIYSEILEGTYLKLRKGESGRLDIVIQFRYMEDDQLVGYRNIKVLSYQIFNISDDKPKFVIREIFRIGKDSDVTGSLYSFSIHVKNTVLNIPTGTGYTSFKQRVYWETDADIRKLEFDMTFDGSMFICSQQVTENYIVDRIGQSVIHITLTNPSRKYVDVEFTCTSPNSDMQKLLLEESEIIIDEVKATSKTNQIITISDITDGYVVNK